MDATVAHCTPFWAEWNSDDFLYSLVEYEVATQTKSFLWKLNNQGETEWFNFLDLGTGDVLARRINFYNDKLYVLANSTNTEITGDGNVKVVVLEFDIQTGIM